ncbi:hypothetical protein WI58_06200 [Burkholderia cepacia]|nr:hypothetical protein WI47_34455 [Burkholderia cepacia]KVA64609.1 hypothetical protein WI49_17435 [Burkholderia cepacia]KVA64792.1 hypothetical protein WI48_05780 [Burkholderia cepacia]KVA82906.1 hypothetical protein WI51_24390 [Burkholderia cepacia]KVA86692.1 hypothetical protein WI50_14980 [Burkholderia cepacia]
MSQSIRVLSAGAAESLIGRIAEDFTSQIGIRVDASFAGVGVLMERIEAGADADIVVLTQPAIAVLQSRGLTDGTTPVNIGAVATSLAVKTGHPSFNVHDSHDLQAALRRADAIYVPDFATTTAGQHMQRVLQTLGLHGELGARLWFAPNGAAAMRALALAQEACPLGCSQASEIVAARGTTFVADLPSPFSLSSSYAMALLDRAQSAQAAHRFIDAVTGASAASVRKACGFR